MNDNDSRKTGIATPTTRPDLILHPVRMQIITTLAGGPLTASQIAQRLADVPPATLYRHLNTLRDGGVIAVAGERKVRGATERHFVLDARAANLGPDDLASATPEDHRRWFAGFVASLLGAFARYTQRGTPDLLRDGVGYREVVLNLTDEEFAAMATALNAAVLPHLANQAGVGRSPRLLATIVMPAD